MASQPVMSAATCQADVGQYPQTLCLRRFNRFPNVHGGGVAVRCLPATLDDWHANTRSVSRQGCL